MSQSHEGFRGSIAELLGYKRYVASLGCHYFFSKRTMGYAVASYAKGTGLLDADDMATNRVITTVGVTHWF